MRVSCGQSVCDVCMMSLCWNAPHRDLTPLPRAVGEVRGHQRLAASWPFDVGATSDSALNLPAMHFQLPYGAQKGKQELSRQIWSR